MRHAALALLLAPLAAGAAAARNVTLVLNANNVVSMGAAGHPPDPKFVVPLGVVASLAACEDLCYKKTAPVCQSFTWHHTDFGKKQYAGHCYAHTDAEWGPVAQGKIDSGCRNDLPHPPPCSTRPAGPAPGPTPTPLKCKTSFDCSGNNGVCQTATGTCKCNAVRPPPHTL